MNPDLSHRERQVIQLISLGMTNKEIGHELWISHKTVKQHVTAILWKLRLRNRTQLAVWWLRQEAVSEEAPGA